MTFNPTESPVESGTALKKTEPEVVEVKVSGEGNGLVDDEVSGGARILGADKPADDARTDVKTANEINGGEGDEDATSQ